MVQSNAHQFPVLLQYYFRIKKGEQVLDHLTRNLDLFIVSGVQTIEQHHQIHIPKHQDRERMRNSYIHVYKEMNASDL